MKNNVNYTAIITIIICIICIIAVKYDLIHNKNNMNFLGNLRNFDTIMFKSKFGEPISSATIPVYFEENDTNRKSEIIAETRGIKTTYVYKDFIVDFGYDNYVVRIVFKDEESMGAHEWGQ